MKMSMKSLERLSKDQVKYFPAIRKLISTPLHGFVNGSSCQKNNYVSFIVKQYGVFR